MNEGHALPRCLCGALLTAWRIVIAEPGTWTLVHVVNERWKYRHLHRPWDWQKQVREPVPLSAVNAWILELHPHLSPARRHKPQHSTLSSIPLREAITRPPT